MSGNNNNYEQSDLYKMRHSAAHVLAQAVLELYPAAKLGIGPPIEDGFYYDFDLGEDADGKPVTFKPRDLARIEKRMRKIIQRNFPFERREIDSAESRALFADQPYKLELIDQFEADGDALTTYRQDSFEDLCRGPHVAHTGEIPISGLKLLHSAGAYWRGDEFRPMLQRIYGTVFPGKAELDAHLALMEEARRRDHRRLGRDLDLFIFDDEIGPGLPLWLPNGNILREELEKLALEKEHDYLRVSTPHIAKEQLYQRSGHLPYYRDEMYAPSEQEGASYYLRPMNCPFHHKIFGDRQRSYRDMPMRIAEYGMVYRYEASGSLFGLMRVRAAQQNDAHIYCTEAQFESEFMRVIDLYRFYFDLFGIDKYVMQLSKHASAELGNKYVDEPEMWLKMEALVREVMIKADVPFVELEDEAAFYGPKIDVQVWSAVGREFSLATNQVDFVQPARFELTYVDRDGSEKTPLCIHRAPLGSHERFVGFLIEHYGGAFPLWLAPVQAVVIPIADRHVDYAYRVRAALRSVGLRVDVDDGPERMNKKIRNAQQQKVPYMLVVGDRESAENSISVRTRENEDRGVVALAEFGNHASGLIAARKNAM